MNIEERYCENCAWDFKAGDEGRCIRDCGEIQGLPRGEIMIEEGKVVCDSWNHFTHPMRESAEKQFIESKAFGSATDKFWEGTVGNFNLLHL